MTCLDSDVVINFLRGDENSVSLINNLEKNNEAIHITAINEFELWKGVLRSNRKDSFSLLKQFIEKVNVLAFDSESSKKSAEIFENLKSHGEMVDVLDVMIASIVITNNQSLLTNNKKHFSRIKGLKLI